MSIPIFTNKAVQKMKDLQLSESYVLDAYNTGTAEPWTNRMGFNSVKKYTGYEIGVAYFTDEKGVTRITSVWKRDRR